MNANLNFKPLATGWRAPLGWCLSAAVFIVSAIHSPAQNSIGINFAGRQWSIGGNTPQTVLATDNAGVISQQNWNNVDPGGHDSGTTAQIVSPAAGVVSDNSGAATGLTLTYSGQGMWSVSKTVYTGNQQLMNGYSDVEGNDANVGSYTVDGIGYSFYDVYVYISADGNGRTAGVSLNGGAQTYLKTFANGYNYANPLLQGAATDQASATNSHYVYFHNVSGATLQLTVHRFGSNVGVSGIQIVDVSGTVYAPSLPVQPQSLELYAGRTAQFSVSASGTQPFAYKWQKNTVNLQNGGKIQGATSNVLTITNISAADADYYDVVVTNIGGTITSSTVQLTVLTPTNAYELAVLTNSPVAYYRLNDTGDSTSGTLPAFDHVGGYNGTYGATVLNQTYGIYGPQPADGFPGFETGNGAAQPYVGYNTSRVLVPAWPLNTNAVTMTAWVYPMGTEANFTGLIVNRGANVAGLNYSGSTDVNGNHTLSYTWNNDPATYGWNSGLVTPPNQWSLVALVVTPTNATIYVANAGGITYSVHTYAHVTQAFTGPISLGNDPSDNAGGRVFNGNLDEVAVFGQALSQSQVTAMFSAASGITNFAPTIGGQPADQSPYEHQNVKFAVTALGSQPLSYQWQVGTNGVFVNLANGGRVSGTTSATLAISNVTQLDAPSYQVIVTNTFGSITSSPAALQVKTSTYADTVLASKPVAYYALNETGDPASGGLVANDYAGGFNGIYGNSVKNGNSAYGIAGPLLADGFPEFATNNVAAQMIPNNNNGHVTVNPWNLNTNTVTITAWIHPNGVQPAWAGVVVTGGAGGDTTAKAGLNFNGSLDANGNRFLSFTWGDNSYFNSPIAPPTNVWSFVALVATPANSTIYLFNTNGMISATDATTNSVKSFGSLTTIGCDPFDLGNRNFNGVIDEVAIFNQALTQAQLASFYSAAQTQSVLLTPAWNGSSLTLSWPGSGVLLQATNLTGPWITNNSASPYTVVPASGAPQLFYRVKVQ